MAKRFSALTLKLLLAGGTAATILLFLSQPQDRQHVSFAADQLLINPGFEAGIEGWLGVGGILSSTSSRVHSGSAAAALDSNSLTKKWVSQVVPVSAGSYYTLSGYVLKNDVRVSSVMLSMHWFSSANGSGSAIIFRDFPPLTANNSSYVQLTTGRILAPAGAKSLSVRVILVPASADSARIYIDDLSLVEEGTTATATATPSATPTPTASPSPSPTSPPAASLLGRVRLQSRGEPPDQRWSVPLTVALHTPGGPPIYQFNPITDPSGHFTLTGVTPGIYDVTVKKGGALAVRNASATLLAGINEIDVGLLWEGDANDDGVVDDGDYLALARAYFEVEGQLAYEPRADFNEDGRIDALDYALLAASYLRRSDELTQSAATRAVRQRLASGRAHAPAVAPAAASFTSTPTASPTPKASPTPTASPTPKASSTPTSSPTPSATASATPAAVEPGELLISEVQYDPSPAGVDSDFEWFELHNASSRSISLAWLKVSDNSGTNSLPSFVLLPGQYVVVAASANFLSLFPGFSGAIVFVDSGRIGNGLSNTGDRLIVQDGRGVVIDAMSYGADRSVFDPSCPAVAAGESLERRSLVDTDGASDFVRSALPSPGRGPNATPTPTPMASPTPTLTATASATSSATSIGTPTAFPTGLKLNEILPAPKDVDWNGDGISNSDDEWIELYNEDDREESLAGWQLGDATSRRFTIPPGTTLVGRGFKLFYGKQTGLSLNNAGDTVNLLRPDGSSADSVVYGSPGYNVSYARIPDGQGNWQKLSNPSPGATNILPVPSPIAHDAGGSSTSPLDQARDRLIPVASARSAPAGTKVTLRAQLTSRPNLLGSRRTYIQDETGGLAVYLRRGAYPPLETGDWVLFTGVMGQRRGEKEIEVYWDWDAVFLERGDSPTPLAVGLNQVGEISESRLAQITGTVEAKTSTSLRLGDGSATARVYVRSETGIDLKPIPTGSHLSVVGVVSQYDTSPPYDEGFRLLPRSPEDIVVLPPPGEPVADAAPIEPSEVNHGDTSTTPNESIAVRPSLLPRAGDGFLPSLVAVAVLSCFLGLLLRIASERL